MEADRLLTMAKLFGIALLIVGPYGFVRIRRTLRETGARRAGAAGDLAALDDDGGSGAADADTGEPDGVDVSGLVAALEQHRREGGELVLVVPPDARVNGRPAPPGVAEAILDDAARRSGLRIAWSSDGADRVATVGASTAR